MASYDSPGHVDPLPGVPGYMGHDSGMNAPGTAPPSANIDTGAGGPNSDSGVPVLVTINGASTTSASIQHVDLVADTLSGSQAQQYGSGPDPLTGIGADLGRTGAGMGNVVTPPHPAAANVGSLSDQLKAARS